MDGYLLNFLILQLNSPSGLLKKTTVFSTLVLFLIFHFIPEENWSKVTPARPTRLVLGDWRTTATQ
jgi:hypothetical protein